MEVSDRGLSGPQKSPCWYCGSLESPINRHVLDHVVPKKLGGLTEPNNLVVACWKCNSAKGGRPVEWLRLHFAHGKNKLLPNQIAHLEALGINLEPYFAKIQSVSFFGESGATHGR